MKYASDFRKIARDALRGKWAIAVIVGLIAMLLGGVGASGPELNFEYNDNGATINLEIANQTIFSSTGGITPKLQTFLVGGAIYIAIAAMIFAVVYFILGSIIEVGYSRFNLDLVDRQKEPEMGTLFGYFSHWKTTAVTKLLRTVYVILWSLLLIIPGIIAFYSYAMTSYILAEHPEMTPSEAIARSKEMMEGNRWRLFCLHFSFIGWSLLSSLTLGIGNLWLTPYQQAATAVFYREISGTEHTPNVNNSQTEYL